MAVEEWRAVVQASDPDVFRVERELLDPLLPREPIASGDACAGRKDDLDGPLLFVDRLDGGTHIERRDVNGLLFCGHADRRMRLARQNSVFLNTRIRRGRAGTAGDASGRAAAPNAAIVWS